MRQLCVAWFVWASLRLFSSFIANPFTDFSRYSLRMYATSLFAIIIRSIVDCSIDKMQWWPHLLPHCNINALLCWFIVRFRWHLVVLIRMSCLSNCSFELSTFGHRGIKHCETIQSTTYEWNNFQHRWVLFKMNRKEKRTKKKKMAITSMKWDAAHLHNYVNCQLWNGVKFATVHLTTATVADYIFIMMQFIDWSQSLLSIIICFSCGAHFICRC